MKTILNAIYGQNEIVDGMETIRMDGLFFDLKKTSEFLLKTTFLHTKIVCIPKIIS